MNKKRVRRTLATLFLVTGSLLVGVGLVAQAGEPTSCPDNVPDTPSFAEHTEQSEIVDGSLNFDEIFARGKALFNANFNICDGRGRPATTGGNDARDPEGQPNFLRTSGPDSNSCAGCHNVPRSGGAGDIVANVFVLAQNADPVITTTDPKFSNFRRTIGMFGSGAIEMLAREMTVDLRSIRDDALQEAIDSGESVTVELVTKGISFGELTAYRDGSMDYSGVRGVDQDLIVKPFHQAGVVVSLREFTVNAMNQHHGMQADERFDLDPTKGEDFDQDGVAHELHIGDITATVIYQAGLGIPGRVLPGDPEAQAVIQRGESLFDGIGCTLCHVPELELSSPMFVEPNPYNPANTWSDAEQSYSFDMSEDGDGPYLEVNEDGTAIVRAYTDLKRHNLCDPEDVEDPIRYYCNEQLAQNRPSQDGRPGAEFFLTRKLWDVGSQPGFGHSGELTTITEAIWMHGGEARYTRELFRTLPVEDQRAIVLFLKSMQVLPAGSGPVIYE